MPKISVIMGVYNTKSIEDLSVSIKSIVNQTFSDWELIICDDGSSNNTMEILTIYANEDERIKLIRNEINSGLSFALNRCISEARGDYIARQDDDDYSAPQRLEKLYNFLELNNLYTFVGSNVNTFDINGFSGELVMPEYPTKKDFKWNSPFIHPSIMIRKEKLLEVNCYRVSKETRRGQDYDLFMRLYAKDYIGYNIQEKLYTYQLVNGSTKKLKFKTRVGEMLIRYRGFKQMGILGGSLVYVIKPIIVWMLPNSLLRKFKRVKNYNS